MAMRIHIAAGVCALSTGLLVAGPAAAVAGADTGAGGASTAPGASAPSTTPSGRATPAAHAAGASLNGMARALNKALQDTTKTAVNGVSGTLNVLAKSGGSPSAGFAAPQVTFGGSRTVHGSTGPAATATEDAVPTASEPDAIASTASSTPTVPVGAPLPRTLQTATDLVVPVSNVAGVLANSAAATPALLASLPTSATPVFDVITSVQNLLTSVVDESAPLAALPAEFASLTDLLGLLGVSGVTTGISADRVEPSAVTTESMPIPAPRAAAPAPTLPGFEGMLTPDELAGPAAALDVPTSGSSRGVARSGSILTPDGTDSSVLSVVENVIGVVVATLSLAAVAAVALPGILGLLGTCAAGIRIGYRQAKAGAELPATAVARFVGSGPVGVVRSGSQISLRPRLVRPSAKQARTPRADPAVRATSLHVLDRAV